MNPHIFREYDIRGVVGKDLNDDSVELLGRAFGTMLRQSGRMACTLGRDCRKSSWGFAMAMAKGMTDCGIDVLDCGTIPTPMAYWSMFLLPVDACVMVTGSHNPKEFNGFKLCMNRTPIFGAQLQELRRMAEAGDFVHGSGSVTPVNVVPSYMEKVFLSARMGRRRLRVVVDAGNGTGGVVAVPLLERLGVEVIPLFCNMDGDFPNHHPDPTVPENLEALKEEVVSRKADLGIAFDGDADRLGIVTEKGETIFGDMILLILARAVLKEVPGAEIVSEVKCSQVLFDEVARLGGRPVMWRVGHSLIKAKMAEDDAALGGEMSGHIFFRHRWYGFDDAIYSATRFLEILSAHDGPASSLLDGVPRRFSTPEIRVDCPDDMKFKLVEVASKTFRAMGLAVVDVDGARVQFPAGWGLVRASNTQPVLVLRFEAESPDDLKTIQTEVFKVVEQARASLAGGES